MKQLYSARNGQEAHELRLFLESQCIAAQVFGGTNALESVFAFTPASAPGVFVAEADFELAAKVLDEFLDGNTTPRQSGTWKCSQCGESVEAQFDLCWNCEAPRNDATIVWNATTPNSDHADSPRSADTTNEVSGPIETTAIQVHSNQQDRREILLEVGAVLAAGWFPYFIYSAVDWLTSPTPLESHFAGDSIASIGYSLSIIAVVLFIMSRSGQPLASFGIRKPHLFADLGAALMILMVDAMAFAFLYRFALTLFEPSVVKTFFESRFRFAMPTTAVEHVFSILTFAAIGLSEELVMRGYLIPRLEYLFGSTWKAVLVSSLLFGSYHLYQGVGGVLSITVTGIVLGSSFAILRRLWPVAIAHAMFDIILSWSQV